MSKTKAQVAAKALGILQVVGSGQSASSEDQSTAETTLVSLLATLRYNNIWNALDDSEFEEEVYLPLARRLAEELAEDIGGRPMDERAVDKAESVLLNIQNQPLSRNEAYVDLGLRQGRFRNGYWDYGLG